MKLLQSLLLLVLAVATTEAVSARVCFRYDNPLCNPQGMRKIRFHGSIDRSWTSVYRFDDSTDCDFHKEERVCDRASAVCAQPGYRNNKGGYTVSFANQQVWVPVRGWDGEVCADFPNI
ncbi:MAG: hypothetical protein JOS17DRAFT_745768 [Linnemannia elongata]|nr:MAG: hypothetical protein JOS17DRAFT_745768 [Linnemannia elongata]